MNQVDKPIIARWVFPDDGSTIPMDPDVGLIKRKWKGRLRIELDEWIDESEYQPKSKLMLQDMLDLMKAELNHYPQEQVDVQRCVLEVW